MVQTLVNKVNMENDKEILVALAGNPNSGKTSLFNKLVGANQKVGNWAGVTVERFEGVTKYKDYKIRVVDLPGTYSLTAYSPEELIARNFILNDKPDIVLNVIDSTNLERNLYLTTQLIDINANLLVALNIYDEIEKEKTEINADQLEILLGPHMVPTSTINNMGVNVLLDHIVDMYTGKIIVKRNKLTFSQFLETIIDEITETLNTQKELSEIYSTRWLAIKLLVGDKDIYKLVKEYPVWIKVNLLLNKAIVECRQKYDTDPEMMLKEERFAFIRGAMKETIEFSPKTRKTTSEIIDSFLINRVTGLPIFGFFMWLIFQLTFSIGETPMNWIEWFFNWLGNNAEVIIPDSIAKSIFIDGILAGVGGVLVFLPNIMILFLCLAFLEGTGYMARAAFVVDKIMHKVGLHGKSFIPMITGFGCSVPAFMATRTLKNEGDRITTLLIIPFMSCGAKFPVYVLIAGTFFDQGDAGNVLFGIYLFGVIIALLSARFLKSAVFKDDSEPFVMELPPYRMPTFKILLFQMWFKAQMYLRKAGTIILAASVLIWFISNYPKSVDIEKRFSAEIEMVEQNTQINTDEKKELISQLEIEAASTQLEYSLAGLMGKTIEPLVQPLGFDWRLGISLVTGIAAKEIVVSTMGTLYAVGDADESSGALRDRLGSNENYNKAVALSFMVFVLLYIPCFAASIVFHREAGKWKWTTLYISYTMTIAWIMSFLTYNISLLFI